MTNLESNQEAGTSAGVHQATDEVFGAERECYDQPGRPDQPFDKRQVVYSTAGGRELAGTLYLPRPPSAENSRPGPAPAIVFAHGGGWWEGDRGQFARQAAFMAADAGIAGLCITYRLSREAPYPACVQDAQCGVRWLRAHAEELNIDPGRIGIGGSSAGAHIAALVATTGQDDPYEPAGGSDGVSSAAQAAVLYNGIFDLPVHAGDRLDPEALVVLLGGTVKESPERYREASPIEHVTGRSPPALLLHGDADQVVSHRQSVRFGERLREAGVPCEVEIVPGVGHGALNDQTHFEPCLHQMIDFLKRHL